MTRQTTRSKKSRGRKILHFQLSYAGLAGVLVVGFCLFCWMFLLGVWAGQTIIPSVAPKPPVSGQQTGRDIPKVLPAGEKKKAVEVVPAQPKKFLIDRAG